MNEDAAPPPPVLVSPPVGEPLPIVVDSPHSGRWYPPDFGAAAPPALLRQGEDLYIDRLWANAPQVGATLIAAQFPRAYIDPNRVLADIDEALLDARWPGPVNPGPKTALGIGLVWRMLGAQPIYDRRLGVAEVQRRIDRCWAPYHAALAAAIEGAHARFGGVWHLNVHSMPDDSYEHLKLPVKPLADFVLGDLDGSTCGAEVVALIETVLRGHGYSVARNDPFKGVEIIARNGRPAERRHSLQIEIKRSCYADVQRHEPGHGFARAQQAIDAMLGALAAHVRGQLGDATRAGSAGRR